MEPKQLCIIVFGVVVIGLILLNASSNSANATANGAGTENQLRAVSTERGELESLRRRINSLEEALERLQLGKQDSTEAGNQVSTSAKCLQDESVPPALRMYGVTPGNKVSTVHRKPQSRLENRWGYDGTGDAPHLGGSTANDTDSQSPSLYVYVTKNINVRSIIDLGCGRGISTKWFLDHGLDILCLEGSSEAIEHSYLPKDLIVQHDFALGPYWPTKTYDLAWSVEFLEHVSRQYMPNYLTVFHKSALIFVTHSWKDGHHHVEIHDAEWWIARMQMQGFVYSESLSMHFRKATEGSIPDGFSANHIRRTALVFINPKVASLPQHAHLIGEPGCELEKGAKRRPCDGLDELPERYVPIFRTPSKWDNEMARLYNLPGAVCKHYPFPTLHDGC